MLKLIVAISEDDVIGVNGRLPWHVPEDLALFKKLTTGHNVVMGRATHQSIGGLLKERDNIILTRDLSFNVPGALMMHAAHEVMEYCLQSKKDTFIIGGKNVFEQFFAHCNELHVSRISGKYDAPGTVKFNLRLDGYNLNYSVEYNGFVYQNYRAANIAP